MRISDWSSDVCSSDLLRFLLVDRQNDGHPPLPDTGRRLDPMQPCEPVAVDRNLRQGTAPAMPPVVFDQSPMQRFVGDFLQLGIQGQLGRASCRERVCQYV